MILDTIYKYKEEELEHFRRRIRLEDLKGKVRDLANPQDMLKALQNPPASYAVIAEIKKKSPSKGVLKEDFDPLKIARDYESHGATALSVLTDEHFFGGHLDHLRQVRAEVKLPLLRKDFIWDAYQVYAAREAGADAILLIAAMLERSQIVDLQGLGQDLGMSVLLEVHNLSEAETAHAVQAKLVGINNRDLQTFQVDVKTTDALLPHLPQDSLKVSESGLDSGQVLSRLKNIGVGAFLIGEAFMKASSPGEALQKLLNS